MKIRTLVILLVFISGSQIFGQENTPTGIVKFAPKEEAIEASAGFVEKHGDDKIVRYFGLNADDKLEVLGVFYINNVKCYAVIGATCYGDVMWTAKAEKLWAYTYVFYENSKGTLNRLNYFHNQHSVPLATWTSRKLALKAYREFLDYAGLKEKALTKMETAEIFIYGVAYGCGKHFFRDGLIGDGIIAASEDISALSSYMTTEDIYQMDTLKARSPSGKIYVAITKYDDYYFKFFFLFNKYGKLQAVCSRKTGIEKLPGK